MEKPTFDEWKSKKITFTEWLAVVILVCLIVITVIGYIEIWQGEWVIKTKIAVTAIFTVLISFLLRWADGAIKKIEKDESTKP